MKTKKLFMGLGVAAALGAAIVPMASYAASDSGNVAVALNVGSTISMSLDSTNVTETLSGADSSAAKTTTATVTTNSVSGYNLSASTSSDDGSLSSNDGDVIAYVGSNFGSETEGWALSTIDENSAIVYKDIAGNVIAGLGGSAAPVDDDESIVTYNFKTNGATVSGTYETVLTYTATTN